MLKLFRYNRFIKFFCEDEDLVKAIDADTSYLLSGRQFAKAFRSGSWDGREHLLKVRASDGAYILPSGLLRDLTKLLKEVGVSFKIVNKTKIVHKYKKFVWNDALTLRGYQEKAVETALETGYGTLKMPARSGKTRTAARLIYKQRLPTIFVVPSKLLLHQTVKSFQEAFPDEKIGIIGDGVKDIQDITVATPQSLQRHWEKEWANRWDMLIIDEAHHYTGGGEWHAVIYRFNCLYRYALSATVFPDNQEEGERGIIWVKALTGPIIIDVPVSLLVKHGWLMKQHVRMYKIRTPDLWGFKWSSTILREAITLNKRRNILIAKLAEKHVRDGSKVLIATNRYEQVDALSMLLEKLDLSFKVLTGKSPKPAREEAIQELVSGKISVIVGTIMREGVDVPQLNVVINAEGMKDEKQTIQRQRNLTICEGKKDAIFIDFYDETNEYLVRHSELRLETYRSEPAFDVKIVEAK